MNVANIIALVCEVIVGIEILFLLLAGILWWSEKLEHRNDKPEDYPGHGRPTPEDLFGDKKTKIEE